MSDKIDYKRIQAIVESAIDMKVSQIIDEKIDAKLAPLQNNIDATLKIATRVEDELIVMRNKVNDHDERLITLESHFAHA